MTRARLYNFVDLVMSESERKNFNVEQLWYQLAWIPRNTVSMEPSILSLKDFSAPLGSTTLIRNSAPIQIYISEINFLMQYGDSAYSYQSQVECLFE